MVRWVLGLGLCVCALGCHVPDVTVSRSAPGAYGYGPADCRALGPVQGSTGLQPQPWKTNENLLRDAMDDLRDRAGRMGANFVHVDRTEGSHIVASEGWVTTVIKVKGTAYRCSRSPAPAPRTDVPAPRDAGPPQEASPPTDAGATIDAARAF
jgi:Domain of unknown function (DUF4156)